MFGRSKNKIQRKSPQERSEKGMKFSRLLFYFLSLVFVAVSGYIVFFSQYLEINNVYIEGAKELRSEKIKEAADSFLEEKYFRMLPNKNMILFRESGLRRRLEGTFKKISSVEVKKIFPNSIVVSISERQALLIWCSGESCFLVDENGTAYATADFGSAEVNENNLIIVHDQSRSEVSGGEVVFDPKFGSFLIGFREKSRDSLDILFDSDFDTPKAISGDFTAFSKEGWRVNLNAEIGAEKEISMLKIVLDKNIEKGKRQDLEYIDLRTEGKVYYKFKSAVPEESEGKGE